MTGAQGWALIGLLGAFATAVVTLMTFLVTSLRNEMHARFEAVDVRFDHLDRDLQAVINRVFRRDEG